MNNLDQTKENDHSSNEITCKNCTTTFIGQYCPNCGQHIREWERPIRFMIVDFMGTIVSFDTRLVKTLGAILFKPGKLTQDFLEGKRARYMPPIRFYVFISFVMFLLISTLTNNSIKEQMDDMGTKTNPIDVLVAINDSTELRDSIMQEVDNQLKANLDSTKYATTKSQIKNNENILTDVLNDVKKVDQAIEKNEVKYSSTIKLIKEHPELYMNKLFQYASWSLFLFMPVFAFFLWILFFRSKNLYIGHLIFSLNIHSFIFTITSIIVALALIFPDHNTQWAGYLYLLTPIYQLIGARKLYQHRWINTFFKLTLVWFLYGFVWFIGLVCLFVFTFMGL